MQKALRTLTAAGSDREPGPAWARSSAPSGPPGPPTTAGRPRRSRAPQPRCPRVSGAMRTRAERRHRAALGLSRTASSARAPGPRRPHPGRTRRRGRCRVPRRPACRSCRPGSPHELGGTTPGRVRPPPTAERRRRLSREPERPELRLPRAGRAGPAAADGVAHVLGRHPRRAAGRRALVPVPSGPDGPDPDRAGPGLRGDRRTRLLRPAQLRQPDRRAVVARARRGRSSTWCATTAPSWSRTTGRTTSASPPTRARRRPGRLRPRHLPALADQERLPGHPRRRGHRPRARPASGSWPTVPPSRMYVSGLLQAAALDVVTQPGWQTHLRSLRQQLRAPDLLVARLREHAGPRRRARTRGRPEPLGPPARRDRPRPPGPGTASGRRVRRGRRRVVPGRAHGAVPAPQLLRPRPSGYPAAARTIEAALEPHP